MKHVFLDLETTGLDPQRDEIWQAAWIVRDATGAEIERNYYVYHHAVPSPWVYAKTKYARAFPFKFAELEHQFVQPYPNLITTVERVLGQLVADCAGDEHVYLVGAVPTFDHSFLSRHMPSLPYNYHIIDVEAMVMGYLGRSAPMNLKELRAALDLPPATEEAHCALVDAREVKLIFDCLIAPRPEAKREATDGQAAQA